MWYYFCDNLFRISYHIPVDIPLCFTNNFYRHPIEQARRHDVAVLVFVENYYAVFEVRYFTGILIRLSPDVLVHLRKHFPIPEIGFT